MGRRQRRAQLSQALRSDAACSMLLCAVARAYTARSAIFSRHARALLSVERCSQCMASSWRALQLLGLRRMPHSSCLSVLRWPVPSAARTACASVAISARRTWSIASMAIETT